MPPSLMSRISTLSLLLAQPGTLSSHSSRGILGIPWGLLGLESQSALVAPQPDPPVYPWEQRLQ